MTDSGFFPAPGTNYAVGQEPTLVHRLTLLAKARGLHLVGLSGYRTPARSVAVGGTPNDPHTQAKASDTPGTETIPEAVLNQYGLTRPMTSWQGRDERDHIQLLPGWTGDKKSGGDGGSILDTVTGVAGDVVGSGATLSPVGAAAAAVGLIPNPLNFAGSVAGDAASATANALVGIASDTLGKDGAKILLYLVFIAGGAVLAGMGAARLFGAHPMAAAQKAGAARALAVAL